MTKHEIICSDDYIDLVVEATKEITDIVASNNNDIHAFHNVGGEYILLHIHKNSFQAFLEQMTGRINFEFPLPMGYLDEIGLNRSGIENIHSQPYMQIHGTGVLIGIIDTGIDYMHPAFIHPDNTTRILRIWDQTIEGSPPEGFYLGHEYTSDDINTALKNENPYSVVGHRDTIGHGTFISGVAAGYDRAAGFTGAAPDAELIIVKIKPAKNNFRAFWMIMNNDVLVCQSTDIVMALQYAAQIANLIGKPIAMNNSFGTNQGPHDGSGISGSIMEGISHRRGVAIISAIGNEGIAGHHARGVIPADMKYHDIELKVGENEAGFCVEIWVPAPDIMSVVIMSPLGESVEMLPKKFNSTETSKLLFERTSITIEYQLANYKNGDQVILIKFKDPTPGIWTITLRSHIYLSGIFNAWLPLSGWIQTDTVFLDPDPSYTATMPGTFTNLISVGAYNHRDESLYIDSSRGPSRIGVIRPDLVAPGVNIVAPWPNGGYATLSGTSIASAIVTGSAALLLEWGIVRKTDPSMNTFKVRNYLIGGARRERNISYPNNTLGYGKLDLYGSFNMMKL